MGRKSPAKPGWGEATLFIKCWADLACGGERRLNMLSLGKIIHLTTLEKLVAR
jgi:hypothetical protein